LIQENIWLQRLPATAVSLTLGDWGVFLDEQVGLVMATRKAWIFKTAAAGALALTCAQADAQSSLPPIGATPAAPPLSAPYATPPANYATPQYATPVQTTSAPLNATDSDTLRRAVDAAQAGDITGARSLQAALTDPVARKLVTWAMIDSAGSSVSFFDLDSARRDLWGWPRPARRQAAAERSIEVAGLSPLRVSEWFEGKDPDTAEGAMALASAYQQLGKTAEAQALIRRYFRDKVFELDAQNRMIGRFGIYLSPDDYTKRLDLLLYGPQGPAAKALLDMVPADVKALATARIALRSNSDDAQSTVALVPAYLQTDPSLAFERARYYRRRNLEGLAAGLVRSFPAPPAGYDEAANLIWTERRALLSALLRSGDAQGAYAAATNHGLPYSENYTEAEFFAGYIALKRLNDPVAAQTHFENIRKAGSSPITLGRALYWAGRAAEARGDMAAAKAFWTEGGKYYTAFYGQLAAEKAGITQISLPPDPVPSADDRSRFEGRDLVRAARMLADSGERDLFRAFVLTLDDNVPNAEELALLVDMARLYGDQDLSMRVVRAGAQRGIYLTERGYPLRQPPAVYGAPEPALVHAIIRQESGFDPVVRSGVGARGMMQIMPATAASTARKIGVGYSADRLNDPTYNMQLGSAYLGEMVSTFSGSYVMAAAGYNAGPGRPPQWASQCGDPRGGTTDPADFIECIPFSETRNYVMRIMEAVQVYRARMNGGVAPLTAMADLKRGAWGGTAPTPVSYNVATIGPTPYENRQSIAAVMAAGGASGTGVGPIPYSQLALRAAEERASVQRSVDIAARRDDERAASAKVEATGKKGGKAKATARLKNKAKVTKAKAKSSKSRAVRRRKS
jgi:soluble lytic murein transglycosylase